MTTTALEATRTTADRSYGGPRAGARFCFILRTLWLACPLAVDLGWSPTAVVATRVGGAFLILLYHPFCFSDGSDCRPAASPFGCWRTGWCDRLAQLCYFSAVQYLSVGVALLLEYLAPVILIAWHWARTQRRPARPVLAGAGLSIVGLALRPRPADWAHTQSSRCGLGSGCCPVSQRVLPAQRGQGPDAPIHPLLLTTAGTGIGAVILLAASAVGILPLAAQTGVTVLADRNRRLVAPSTVVDLDQRGTRVPERHRRGAPAWQLPGIVRFADRGDLRWSLLSCCLGSVPGRCSCWGCVDLVRDRAGAAASQIEGRSHLRSGSAEVGDQPDLAVHGVVDHVDADIDVGLAQDVAAVAVVGRLLVVHRLLHGENAALRAAGVVGDVLRRRRSSGIRQPRRANRVLPHRSADGSACWPWPWPSCACAAETSLLFSFRAGSPWFARSALSSASTAGPVGASRSRRSCWTPTHGRRLCVLGRLPGRSRLVVRDCVAVAAPPLGGRWRVAGARGRPFDRRCVARFFSSR